MTTEITITTEKRMIEAGDYTFTLTTSARDYIGTAGRPFILDFKVRKIGTRWHIRPVDELVWGKSMWSVESLKAAEERIMGEVKYLVTPPHPLMAGLTFHRNSGGYLCYSGTMELEGDIAYVYVSRQPGPRNQMWSAKVSVNDFTSPIYGFETQKTGPFPLPALQRALKFVEEMRLARNASKAAVVACEAPQEEVEHILPEPPLDEEDTVEMQAVEAPATEVTVKVTIESEEPPYPGSITYTVKDEAPDEPPQPQELPEEAQKAVGYLQEIIAFLECGVALSETQQKVYDKALRMAEFEDAATEYGSLAVLKDDDTFFIAGEDEDFEDEFEQLLRDDDPDYYDDYPTETPCEHVWGERMDDVGNRITFCTQCNVFGWYIKKA